MNELVQKVEMIHSRDLWTQRNYIDHRQYEKEVTG